MNRDHLKVNVATDMTFNTTVNDIGRMFGFPALTGQHVCCEKGLFEVQSKMC